MVDVQVDFTGLVRRAHRSPRDRVQHCTPKVSQVALTRADHLCYRGEIPQQLFKIEIILQPGWAVGLTLSGTIAAKKVLNQVMPQMRQARVKTDQGHPSSCARNSPINLRSSLEVFRPDICVDGNCLTSIVTNKT